ncbi:SoxR reducing system RseC family protein [candidate division KSB1 bacterium]|nr:SoxR reducing system RseC family protein [candidate division KSB1 bacterium]
MREPGEIIRVEQDKGVVRLNPHGGCDKCGLNGVCHTTGSSKRELQLSVGQENFTPGELVEIETAPGGVITAAFLVFILPLILSITAYMLVSGRSDSEGYAILAFLVTFALSELLIMGIDRVIGSKQFFQPRIVKRLSPDSEFK